MRRHINFLYGIVVVLLVLQIVSFVAMSNQASRIISQQEKASGELERSLEGLREENQFNINEIVDELAAQREDLDIEIELLKASQKDFSGVIEDSIREVVNIRTDKSAGTGFIIDSRGYVVTNSHIIDGSSVVRVQTFDGEVYEARVVGSDSVLDVALLKISGFFDRIELADSGDVQVGEKVIAIGNPLGLSFTVTEGIVSGLKRKGPNGLDIYIQTDVTLNPGNSGGPLINSEGKVIGVNNFKIGGAEGLGFALESNTIKESVMALSNNTLVL